MTAPSDVDGFLDSAEVFILSGGAARRAGGINKSLIRVADASGQTRPIVEHQMERLRRVFADRVTVITDREADFAPLGLKTLPDFEAARPEDRYPLRGFARALAAASGWAFLLAADMPWPDIELIRAQAQRLIGMGVADRSSGRASVDEAAVDTRGPLGLVVEHGGRLQPFHAFYHARLAVSARSALGGEDRSLRAWITSEPAILSVDGVELLTDAHSLELAFQGFNTPPEA